MSEKKSLMPLAAITTVLLLAVITRPNPEESPKDGLGTPMVPTLKANAEAIDAITIRQGGGTTLIRRVASQWQCASAADYPVDRERIRQLLVQLDQLERWEAKTQDPARHAAIDLDVSTEGARAIEIELFAESDLVSHVILGKQQWSPKSTFARLATEDQTFKCKGHVEVEVNPIGWLETNFCTLDRSGIAEMNFGPMRLVRANTSPESTNDSWDLAADTLDLVPDKAVQLARAELPGWPTRLDFDDVIARDQHQWSNDTVVLTYITREGQLTVSIDLGEEEGSGAWCGLDFVPSQGQNLQPKWSRWPRWVYRLPAFRVTPIRQIQSVLQSATKNPIDDSTSGPSP